MAIKTLTENNGNIAVIVAISLTALIGMLALVVDGGYLYSTKDKYQNGVEAAALAAAIHICDGDYETIARQIALDNNIPYESAYLSVEIGYYDLGDAYEDFAVYKEFVADSYPGTSYNDELSDPGEDLYVYNNAVMISLNADVSTFLAGLFGKEQAAVSAKAVGVARSVGLLSFGDDPDTSGIVITNWNYEPTPADFLNCGVIHSNTDVEFCSAPCYVNLNGDTLVTAAGDVYNCPEGEACLSGETAIYPETDLDDIMDDLKAEAISQGRLIDMSDDNVFTDDGTQDGDGNWYRDDPTSHRVFGPHPGDHNGAVYYFVNPSNNRLTLVAIGDDDVEAWNFTVAAEASLTFSTQVGGASDDLLLGKPGEGMVHLYTTGDVGGHMGFVKYQYGALGEHEFHGVTFRIGGSFMVRPSLGDNNSPQKLRIIAEGLIDLYGYFAGANPYYFRADFGPPCPPIKVGLGKLEPTTGG
jgi:hypothetical protein